MCADEIDRRAQAICNSILRSPPIGGLVPDGFHIFISRFIPTECGRFDSVRVEISHDDLDTFLTIDVLDDTTLDRDLHDFCHLRIRPMVVDANCGRSAIPPVQSSSSNMIFKQVENSSSDGKIVIPTAWTGQSGLLQKICPFVLLLLLRITEIGELLRGEAFGLGNRSIWRLRLSAMCECRHCDHLYSRPRTGKRLGLCSLF